MLNAHAREHPPTEKVGVKSSGETLAITRKLFLCSYVTETSGEPDCTRRRITATILHACSWINACACYRTGKRRGQRSWFESHTPRGFAGEVALSAGERPGRLCLRGKFDADLRQS